MNKEKFIELSVESKITEILCVALIEQSYMVKDKLKLKAKKDFNNCIEKLKSTVASITQHNNHEQNEAFYDIVVPPINDQIDEARKALTSLITKQLEGHDF